MSHSLTLQRRFCFRSTLSLNLNFMRCFPQFQLQILNYMQCLQRIITCELAELAHLSHRHHQQSGTPCVRWLSRALGMLENHQAFSAPLKNTRGKCLTLFHHKILLVSVSLHCPHYVLLMSLHSDVSQYLYHLTTNSELISKFARKTEIAWYMMHVDAFHIQDLHPPNPSVFFTVSNTVLNTFLNTFLSYFNFLQLTSQRLNRCLNGQGVFCVFFLVFGR